MTRLRIFVELVTSDDDKNSNWPHKMCRDLKRRIIKIEKIILMIFGKLWQNEDDEKGWYNKP